MSGVSREKFGTIIADPPWPYYKAGKNHKRASGYVNQDTKSHYSVMSMEELESLPVGEVSSDHSVLLLWTTSVFSAGGDASQLCRAWGFEPVTYLYWIKTTIRGKLNYGVGYWFRGTVEPIIVGKRKKSYRTNERNAFVSPVGRHSKKPPTLHELALKHFPGPYLELFAREDKKGWTCLGEELTGNDIRDDLDQEVLNQSSIGSSTTREKL